MRLLWSGQLDFFIIVLEFQTSTNLLFSSTIILYWVPIHEFGLIEYWISVVGLEVATFSDMSMALSESELLSLVVESEETEAISVLSAWKALTYLRRVHIKSLYFITWCILFNTASSIVDSVLLSIGIRRTPCSF